MKERLDSIVCRLRPDLSKTKAQALIMSGMVFVNNQKETKCGSMFPEDAKIMIKGSELKYVSRGGLKLEKAMQAFLIDLKDKICMDIGASTGGFTDCMLQNGAKKVYSVDVGKGQLDWKLRNDDRVVVMEKTNIRYVTSENIKEKINFISIDVSFISLTLVVPVALDLLDEKKEIVMLIKPQFEAGREKVGKKGVVRDALVHIEVIEKIVRFVKQEGLFIKGLDYSPIKGPEGNIEYLLYAGCEEDTSVITRTDKKASMDEYEKDEIKKIDNENIEMYIKQTVAKAHEELDK